MASIFDLLGMGTQGVFNVPPPTYNTPVFGDGAYPNTPQPPPETVDNTPIVSDPAPVHKGLFGIKGTLRDLLGAVGDFKANMEGKTGRYEMLRNREEAGDAMRSYDPSDPQSAATAIRRMFKVDPNTGRDMLKDYQEQQAKRLLAEQKRRELGLSILQNMAGTINDEATYSKMAPLLRQTAQRYGVDPADYEPFLGDTYDKDRLGAFRYGGFDVDKQEALRETARYHDLQDENYDERTEISRKGTEARISQGNARVSQGAARTSAYLRDVENKIERRNNPVARPSAGRTIPRPKGVTPPTPPKGYIWKKKGS